MTIRHWILKSEPECYSWADMERDGTTPWSGVRNHQAQNYMKAMAPGHRGLFYHSVKERACVGLVEVSSPFRPDPTDESGRFGMVEVRTVKPLPHRVTLEQIKAHPLLADMPLVRQSRLSISPVRDDQWRALMELAGL